MKATEGETEFPHVPDWYKWERECVKLELENGEYGFCEPVDIYMIVNANGVYNVGKGELSHGKDGFRLTGCDGKLNYEQKPLSSYGLYSDYYWYEIGDMICIGNKDALYYCFPKTDGVVAKTRIAAEEIYKMKASGTRRPCRRAVTAQ